jgi:hypothetical protein
MAALANDLAKNRKERQERKKLLKKNEFKFLGLM